MRWFRVRAARWAATGGEAGDGHLCQRSSATLRRRPATHPAADVSSVRFVRNTPGLRPLVDDKAAKLEKTRFIDRRLVQVVVAAASPLVGERVGRLGWREAGQGGGGREAQVAARPHPPLAAPCLQARRCVSCSSATRSTAWWWPSPARASACR